MDSHRQSKNDRIDILRNIEIFCIEKSFTPYRENLRYKTEIPDNKSIDDVKLSDIKLVKIKPSDIKLDTIKPSDIKLENIKLSDIKSENIKPEDIKVSDIGLEDTKDAINYLDKQKNNIDNQSREVQLLPHQLIERDNKKSQFEMAQRLLVNLRDGWNTDQREEILKQYIKIASEDAQGRGSVARITLNAIGDTLIHRKLVEKITSQDSTSKVEDNTNQNLSNETIPIKETSTENNKPSKQILSENKTSSTEDKDKTQGTTHQENDELEKLSLIEQMHTSVDKQLASVDENLRKVDQKLALLRKKLNLVTKYNTFSKEDAIEKMGEFLNKLLEKQKDSQLDITKVKNTLEVINTNIDRSHENIEMIDSILNEKSSQEENNGGKVELSLDNSKEIKDPSEQHKDQDKIEKLKEKTKNMNNKKKLLEERKSALDRIQNEWNTKQTNLNYRKGRFDFMLKSLTLLQEKFYNAQKNHEDGSPEKSNTDKAYDYECMTKKFKERYETQIDNNPTQLSKVKAKVRRDTGEGVYCYEYHINFATKEIKCVKNSIDKDEQTILEDTSPLGSPDILWQLCREAVESQNGNMSSFEFKVIEDINIYDSDILSAVSPVKRGQKETYEEDYQVYKDVLATVKGKEKYDFLQHFPNLKITSTEINKGFIGTFGDTCIMSIKYNIDKKQKSVILSLSGLQDINSLNNEKKLIIPNLIIPSNKEISMIKLIEDIKVTNNDNTLQAYKMSLEEIEEEVVKCFKHEFFFELKEQGILPSNPTGDMQNELSSIDRHRLVLTVRKQWQEAFGVARGKAIAKRSDLVPGKDTTEIFKELYADSEAFHQKDCVFMVTSRVNGKSCYLNIVDLKSGVVTAKSNRKDLELEYRPASSPLVNSEMRFHHLQLARSKAKELDIKIPKFNYTRAIEDNVINDETRDTLNVFAPPPAYLLSANSYSSIKRTQKFEKGTKGYYAALGTPNVRELLYSLKQHRDFYGDKEIGDIELERGSNNEIKYISINIDDVEDYNNF